MTVNTVNGSAATAYIAQQAVGPASKESEDQKISAQRIIEDQVDLSPRAQQFIATGQFQVSELPDGITSWQREGYSSFEEQFLDGTGFSSWQEFRAYHDKLGEYGEARGEFTSQNFEEMNAIMSRLLDESNGLLNGAAFNPEDLSQPITTTNGQPHPQANAIRAFVQAHQAEYDQLKAIRQRTFPSFEQWQAS